MAEEYVTEYAGEYVRKDVFDATIQRIDQRFDALEKRMDERFNAMNAKMDQGFAQLRAEMKASNDRLEQEIKATNDRMDQGFALMTERMEKNLAEFRNISLEIRSDVRALSTRVDSLEYWGTIVFGAAALLVGVMQYFHSRRESDIKKHKEELLELRKVVISLVDAGKLAASR